MREEYNLEEIKEQDHPEKWDLTYRDVAKSPEELDSEGPYGYVLQEGLKLDGMGFGYVDEKTGNSYSADESIVFDNNGKPYVRRLDTLVSGGSSSEKNHIFRYRAIDTYELNSLLDIQKGRSQEHLKTIERMKRKMRQPQKAA